MLSQVVELIESKRRFAITSHIRPDGDSLGSSLGLYWLLRALDKDVEIIMRDPAPHSYQQLPGAKKVRVTPAVDQSYDAVFVIECSDISRPRDERDCRMCLHCADHRHRILSLLKHYRANLQGGIRVGAHGCQARQDGGGCFRQLPLEPNSIDGGGSFHSQARREWSGGDNAPHN